MRADSADAASLPELVRHRLTSRRPTTFNAAQKLAVGNIGRGVVKALRARGRQGGGASWRRAWSIAAVIGVVLMANWTTAFAAQPAPSGNGRLSPIGRPTVAPATRPGTPPSHRLTHTPLVKDPAALAATKQRVSARKGGAVNARASGMATAPVSTEVAKRRRVQSVAMAKYFQTGRRGASVHRTRPAVIRLAAEPGKRAAGRFR